LVQRAAAACTLDLRLVTAHWQTRILAREVDIPVYLMVPPKLRRYRRERRLGGRGLAARVLPVEERLGWRWEHRPRPLGIGTAFLTLVVIAIVLGAMAAVAVALAPSATVRLSPVTKTVAGNFEVTANPTYREIETTKAIIPARVIQVIVEGFGETPATGRIDVPDGKAVGELVLANRTTSKVVVPKGTVVRTGSGTPVRFYTVAGVELPAVLYGSARVGITAAEAGPSGNVAALTINVVDGEAARSVDVFNDKPTTGGFMKRVARVAAADFDQMRADMISRLQRDAYAQLVGGLGKGEIVPANSLSAQVMSEQFNQVLGEESDVLSMRMKVVVQGVAVDGLSLNDLMARLLNERAGEELKLIPSSLVVERGEEMRVEGTTVRFQVAARGMAARNIDQDQTKAALRGKTVPEGVAWLKSNLQLRGDPVVVVEPDWWEYLPFLPGRMHIQILAEER
jgi:hypothetical protein